MPVAPHRLARLEPEFGASLDRFMAHWPATEAPDDDRAHLIFLWSRLTIQERRDAIAHAEAGGIEAFSRTRMNARRGAFTPIRWVGCRHWRMFTATTIRSA